MARTTCRWPGKSGRKYKFFVYTLAETNIISSKDGNYIYARLWVDRDGTRRFTPLYIGEGNLADRSNLDSHQRSDCLRDKGATHFHCHLNGDKGDRTEEEQDLLAKWTKSYSPTGCNRKKGG